MFIIKTAYKLIFFALLFSKADYFVLCYHPIYNYITVILKCIIVSQQAEKIKGAEI